MINNLLFRSIMKARFLHLLSIALLPILFICGCERPGGQDENGNSYTYGMQITSVLDAEEGSTFIVFDFSTPNLTNDESAQVVVSNVIPSNSGSTGTTTGTSTISDETNSLHLTAYRVDYHIDGFSSLPSFVGKINILVSAGGSQTFNLLLIAGYTKKEILNTLGYEYKKGSITITISGYDGNGKDISKSIDVDLFVYTYLRLTPTPTLSKTATPSSTGTGTNTPAKTYTITPTPTITL